LGQNQEEKLFEEKWLAETIAVAKEQLKQSREAAEEKKDGITKAKRDVYENSSHSFTNLYSSDDFEALVELNQLHSHVTDEIADYEKEIKNIQRLENIVKTPYFARIDFLFEGDALPEKIYIGRSPLSKKRAGEIYVYDWRSPIASVFYRFMTGMSYYDAPNGRINGEVTLKRQYEIKDSVLQYYFDADRNISDEFLRQLLSKNASPKMKAVVETIQKEQDMVIRDMGSDLLMVQGIAGSGKTSIALHRAAYLMYEGLQKEKLSAENILIISPNPAFEQYISDVLPELGEENVNSVVFDDILKKTLRGRKSQPVYEFLEEAVTNGRQKETVKSSMEFKTSKEFQDVLDCFLAEIPVRWMEFSGISHHGECVVTGKELQEWVLRRPEVALGMRLEQVEEFVMEKIYGTGGKRADEEEILSIQEQIRQSCNLRVVDLYSRLFLDGAEWKGWKGCTTKIWEYTRRNLQSGRLGYDDAIAVAYLYLKLYGSGEYRNIRQVVIDEAQDYYPLQYEIFRMLFPSAKFTVLADIHQAVGKTESMSMYERIRKTLNRKKSLSITLNKSFRCTNEILKFSQQFLGRELEVESFNRSGDCPQVFVADSHKKLLRAVKAEANLCLEKWLKTVCLLCKTHRNAVRLYEELKEEMTLQLVQGREVESLQGVFLMPVYMAKGLEFDAVIICDADDRNYCDMDDRNLLYVECTRALHRLSLMGEGKISRFAKGLLPV